MFRNGLFSVYEDMSVFVVMKEYIFFQEKVVISDIRSDVVDKVKSNEVKIVVSNVVLVLVSLLVQRVK